MNHTFSFYYLYCINKQCNVSIHRQAKQVELLFTEENLTSEQTCTCCSQELVSSFDLGIESLLAQAGITNSKSRSIFQIIKNNAIRS